MHNNALNTLLAAATLAACAFAGQAGARPLPSSGILADRHDHGTRKFEPFMDGSHGTRKFEPFMDGSHGTRKFEPFMDGSQRDARGLDVAGLDRSGVSAPPAHAPAATQV